MTRLPFDSAWELSLLVVLVVVVELQLLELLQLAVVAPCATSQVKKTKNQIFAFTNNLSEVNIQPLNIKQYIKHQKSMALILTYKY